MLNIIIAHFQFLIYTSRTSHKENSGTA